MTTYLLRLQDEVFYEGQTEWAQNKSAAETCEQRLGHSLLCKSLVGLFDSLWQVVESIDEIKLSKNDVVWLIYFIFIYNANIL